MNNTQKALINQDVCEQTTPNLGITQSSGLDWHEMMSHLRRKHSHRWQKALLSPKMMRRFASSYTPPIESMIFFMYSSDILPVICSTIRPSDQVAVMVSTLDNI